MALQASKFTDATQNPILIPATGATPVAPPLTTTPFTPVTVADPNVSGTVETLNIVLAPSIIGSNAGSLADPNGGGSFDAATNHFTEATSVNGASSLNQILARLVYTPPPIADGQTASVKATMNTLDTDVVTGSTSLTTDSKIDLLQIVSAPNVTPGVPTQPDAGASINPWSLVTVTDNTSSTALDSAKLIVSDPDGTPTDADGLLTGIGLSKTGTGTYSVPNPIDPATMVSVLKNLTFTPSAAAAGKTTNIELDLTNTQTGLTHVDKKTSVITPDVATTPIATTTDPMVFDTSTGLSLTNIPDPPTKYPGAVIGPTSQYINVTPDSLNITVNSSNWFIHSGAGEDAIKVSNGINVLDGGTGSNFLVGGQGTDTFFVDARNAPSDVWSSVANFHSGDDATMFGIAPGMFNIAMVDNDGAAGFKGLTFHATAQGKPEASLTLAGFTQADLASGKISQGFGTEPDGTTFMKIHAA